MLEMHIFPTLYCTNYNKTPIIIFINARTNNFVCRSTMSTKKKCLEKQSNV